MGNVKGGENHAHTHTHTHKCTCLHTHKHLRPGSAIISSGGFNKGKGEWRKKNYIGKGESKENV